MTEKTDWMWVYENPKDAAAEIDRLRAALVPFADYYEVLARNGNLSGFDLIARKDGAILGHADIQSRDITAAWRALNDGQSLQVRE